MFATNDSDRATDMTLAQALTNLRNISATYRGTRKEIVLIDQSFEMIEERLKRCDQLEAAAKSFEEAKNGCTPPAVQLVPPAQS